MPNTRAQKKKAATTQPIQPFDWKAHPVVIASGSAAATLLLCIAVFTQIIGPTQSAKLEIEMLKVKESSEELEEKVESLLLTIEKDREKAAELRTENSHLNQTISELRKEVISLQLGNLFTPGNPYPNGLGVVRIGMSRSRIFEFFGKDAVSESESSDRVLNVSRKDSAFDRITFFLNKDDTISHLSFDLMRSAAEGDFLYIKLVEAFGNPAETKRKNKHRWRVGSHDIFVFDYTGLVILPKGHEPLFWSIDD